MTPTRCVVIAAHVGLGAGDISGHLKSLLRQGRIKRASRGQYVRVAGGQS